MVGRQRLPWHVVSWDRIDSWWLEELAGDPAYEEEIEPLLLSLLQPELDLLYLDLGCGEGRLMRRVKAAGSRVVGCDLSPLLLSRAIRHGPVVRCALPSLKWVKPASFDGAYVGLVLEHLRDEKAFFASTANVVRPGGVLALVINHPIWTAPKSSPIEDAGGEILWRPGEYFGRGFSKEPAGDDKVTFYHRTMASLVNAASVAGWDLHRMEERGLSPEQVKRVPDLEGQQHIPRLLGARWKRR
jgi:SAM-dependent methyltransferase